MPVHRMANSPRIVAGGWLRNAHYSEGGLRPDLYDCQGFSLNPQLHPMELVSMLPKFIYDATESEEDSFK